MWVERCARVALIAISPFIETKVSRPACPSQEGQLDYSHHRSSHHSGVPPPWAARAGARLYRVQVGRQARPLPHSILIREPRAPRPFVLPHFCIQGA